MRAARLRSAAAAFLLLAAAPAAAQTPADVRAARDLMARADSALGAGDPAAARALFERAAAHRPAHPTILYNLAAALSLSGDPAGARRVLGALAEMGIALDPSGVEAFAAARGPAFDSLAARLRENARPRVASDTAFSLPDADFVPEGIAHDPATGGFLVGGVHARRIVAVAPDGAVAEFGRGREDGLWSVLGMAADPARRRLWVATSALPETPEKAEGEEGRTALLEYALDGGRLLARHLLPGDGSGALGDVAVGPEGEVYASDGTGGGVYRLRPGADALEALVPPGRLASPQGMALSADGGTLYLADYSLGMVAVDLRDGSVASLAAPRGATLLGIDGLARHGDALIAVQNGVRPARVLLLRLAPGGRALAEARVLEASHPAYDEPTLGVVVDGALHYVANSQWSRFRGGVLQRDPPLARPVILRLPLPPGG